MVLVIAMGLRERLNRHQGVSILASLSVVALVVLWSYMRTSEPSIPKQLSFYTADDGATLFSDESKKVPPFDHDGTQAVAPSYSPAMAGIRSLCNISRNTAVKRRGNWKPHIRLV